MIYTDDLVPIISKEGAELRAEKFLEMYCPQALTNPMVVPLELIAEKDMGLTIDYVNLTEDLSILGMMAFTDGKVEIYKKDTDEYVYELVKKGTILIDSDLYDNGGRARERFTIAHEMAHWSTHRLRYTRHLEKDKSMPSLCRCPAKPVLKVRTPDEWLEWQADSIGAAMLMPRRAFVTESVRLKKKYKHYEGWEYGEAAFGELITRELATTFDVSKQAAGIRLSNLGIKI